MLYGKKFKVIKDFKPIYKLIGDYEAFYAYEENNELEYGIIDDMFGQPSPANWSDTSYAKLMRGISNDYLQTMLDEGIIELM